MARLRAATDWFVFFFVRGPIEKSSDFWVGTGWLQSFLGVQPLQNGPTTGSNRLARGWLEIRPIMGSNRLAPIIFRGARAATESLQLLFRGPVKNRMVARLLRI